MLSADAYLLSYPKCGRTWLRYMVGAAFEAHFHVASSDTFDLFQLARLQPGIPKVLVEHDGNPHRYRADELDESKQCYRDKRVLLLVRDPRDVIVSYYHQRRYRNALYEGSLSSFVKEPVGSTATLLRYYALWAEAWAAPKQVLLVRYEDLHRQPSEELRRVLDFVGLRLVPDSVVDAAIERASFTAMRNLELRNGARSACLRPGQIPGEESMKTRRGVVGGYTSYLSDRDITFIETQMAETLPPMFGYAPCRQHHESR